MCGIIIQEGVRMSIIFVNDSKQRKFNNYKKDLDLVYKQAINYFELPKDTSLSCILVDQQAMIAYNSKYRNKNQSTDVLTFVDDTQGNYLGDIIINVQAIVEQAHEYGHTIKREICFLFAHGLLHTLGFDHHQPEEEATMIAHQKEILKNVSKRSYQKSNPQV